MLRQAGGDALVEVGWFAQDGFTLWRSQNLSSGNWSEVAGQALENDGGATIFLRDPAPPAGSSLYRVTSP